MLKDASPHSAMRGWILNPLSEARDVLQKYQDVKNWRTWGWSYPTAKDFAIAQMKSFVESQQAADAVLSDLVSRENLFEVDVVHEFQFGSFGGTNLYMPTEIYKLLVSPSTTVRHLAWMIGSLPFAPHQMGGDGTIVCEIETVCEKNGEGIYKKPYNERHVIKKELRRDATMADLGINGTSMIGFELGDVLARSYIRVKMLSGKLYMVDLDDLETVWDLRGVIAKIQGQPRSMVRMICNGVSLDIDENSLETYRLKDGDEVHAVLPLGCRPNVHYCGDMGYEIKDGRVTMCRIDYQHGNETVKVDICVEGAMALTETPSVERLEQLLQNQHVANLRQKILMIRRKLFMTEKKISDVMSILETSMTEVSLSIMMKGVSFLAPEPEVKTIVTKAPIIKDQIKKTPIKKTSKTTTKKTVKTTTKPAKKVTTKKPRLYEDVAMDNAAIRRKDAK